MITSRALVERNPKTLRLIRFEADEQPRSIQLYGVDPAVVAAAVRMIADEDLADHVDLNFGCPVPKVTRKGGGSALPWRIDLFDDIVRGGGTRGRRRGTGDGEDAGRHRRAAPHLPRGGVCAPRTPASRTSRCTAAPPPTSTAVPADWTPIAELVELLDIPVLGNGDIWEADDALRMMRETGCAGVVVGRGCLGRPWLFADLAAAFAGRAERVAP